MEYQLMENNEQNFAPINLVFFSAVIASPLKRVTDNQNAQQPNGVSPNAGKGQIKLNFIVLSVS